MFNIAARPAASTANGWVLGIATPFASAGALGQGLFSTAHLAHRESLASEPCLGVPHPAQVVLLATNQQVEQRVYSANLLFVGGLFSSCRHICMARRCITVAFCRAWAL